MAGLSGDLLAIVGVVTNFDRIASEDRLAKNSCGFLGDSVEDGAGSKWLLVHKVLEQLHEKQSKWMENAYKLHPLAIVLLNVLYKFC